MPVLSFACRRRERARELQELELGAGARTDVWNSTAPIWLAKAEASERKVWDVACVT
jgi:hypothetical protein